MPQAQESPKMGSEPKLSAFVLMVVMLLFVFGLLSRIGKIQEPMSAETASDDVRHVSSLIGSPQAPIDHYSDFIPAPRQQSQQPSSPSVAQAPAESQRSTRGVGPVAQAQPNQADRLTARSQQDTLPSVDAIQDAPVLDAERQARELDETAQRESGADAVHRDAPTQNADSAEQADSAPGNKVKLPARDRKGDRLSYDDKVAMDLPAESRTKKKDQPDKILKYLDVEKVSVVSKDKANKDTGKKYHVLQPGETLWKVAMKYYGNGNDWKKLVAANKGLDPKRVIVGRKIVIPEDAIAMSEIDR